MEREIRREGHPAMGRERDSARETDSREIRERRPARVGRRGRGRQWFTLFVAGVGRGKMEMARRIFG
jgi:hypothetical protein